MKYWLITDTHFNHKNMVKLYGRPENFTELILGNWKGALSPDDITIHLGDVIFGQAGKLTEYLNSVPGKKILVRGNHDYNSNKWYLEHGFDFVCDSFVMKHTLFTHIPVLQLPDNAVVNVHGHLHNSHHHDTEIVRHDWQKLLAMEYTDYKPVELDKFVEMSGYMKFAPDPPDEKKPECTHHRRMLQCYECNPWKSQADGINETE